MFLLEVHANSPPGYPIHISVALDAYQSRLRRNTVLVLLRSRITFFTDKAYCAEEVMLPTLKACELILQVLEVGLVVAHKVVPLTQLI